MLKESVERANAGAMYRDSSGACGVSLHGTSRSWDRELYHMLWWTYAHEEELNSYYSCHTDPRLLQKPLDRESLGWRVSGSVLNAGNISAS